MNNDETYMRRAIELAMRGVGWTNPNPMVGAVIVKDGIIIGEGYHQKCGELHAERNAFKNLTESAKGATIYVTLEPCCHHGLTPPCTEAIIENGIKRVVIGSRDPNPLVAGKGAKLLREHGIVVEEDFMRDECDSINPIFFHYITTKKPYVTAKYAMTLDGKIACFTGESKWITGENARNHVQKIRGQYAAIMAGIGTVLADNPMLNCRIDGAHNPLRIVLDSKLRIPMDSKLVQSANKFPLMIVCEPNVKGDKKKELEDAGAEVLEIPFITDEELKESKTDLRKLMLELGKRRIDSVLIEGGGKVHEEAFRQGIVNHVCAYIAPKIFGGENAKTPVEGKGVKSPLDGVLMNNRRITELGEDILVEYDVKDGMNGVYWNC